MKNFFNNTKKFVLNNFTLAKLLAAFFSALIVATLKYYISGNLHLEYDDFWNNIAVALLGWTIHTGVLGLLTDFLGIKGLDFNLNQFIYGFDTLKAGEISTFEESKPKLYSAMDSDGESNPNEGIDKGKGVDKELHPHYDRSRGIRASDPIPESNTLNKGKDKVKVNVLLDPPAPVEPHMVTWSKVFPGLHPDNIIPKRTNPGPGFNVPGGDVPIRDDICRHLDYNTHFLKQFRTMDLETAIEQRNNYMLCVRVIESKLDYAKNALDNIPQVPRTEFEFKLKNQILRDLDSLSQDKLRAEGRATLLSSRIAYIESFFNNNK